MESETNDDEDWRKESGLLVNKKKANVENEVNHIWGDFGYRVFLSHKSKMKKETALLKEALSVFSISCLAAHEDIHPGNLWQDEIEKALWSMGAFVALLTDDFHDSNWTDQEVGFALGRDIPIICIRMGTDPYGFIGKFQALRCGWDTAPIEIAKLLIYEEKMKDAYIEAMKQCPSFSIANKLAEILPLLKNISKNQMEKY